MIIIDMNAYTETVGNILLEMSDWTSWWCFIFGMPCLQFSAWRPVILPEVVCDFPFTAFPVLQNHYIIEYHIIYAVYKVSLNKTVSKEAIRPTRKCTWAVSIPASYLGDLGFDS